MNHQTSRKLGEGATEGGANLPKIGAAQPLSTEDPIWRLIGAGESGQKDISADHDRYFAAGEKARWEE